MKGDRALPAGAAGMLASALADRSVLDINDVDRSEISNRVKRARGQLDGVLSMIEHDRSSAEIVTQMGAASTAIDHAARRLVAVSLMQRCGDTDAPGAITEVELEGLLLSLS